jgi:vancomycin resistance protein YoaR
MDGLDLDGCVPPPDVPVLATYRLPPSLCPARRPGSPGGCRIAPRAFSRRMSDGTSGHTAADRRRRAPRFAPLALAAAVLGLSAGGAVSALLPSEGRVARGVRVSGAAVPDDADALAFAEARAAEALARPLSLVADGREVQRATPAELGATVDTAAITRFAMGVARRGDLATRLREALDAREGRVDVPVRVAIPIETLAALLEPEKEARDAAPRAARLDATTRAVTPHHAGRYIDVYATAAAIDRALAGGLGQVELALKEIQPRASSEVVAAIDTSQTVSRYETRFGVGGAQAGRAQNVARAASLVDGVVLMPGEVVSFNAEVGPRSEGNGFTKAPEIYKGELREGVGGGTCQVASTLHAAAFFGGLDVVARANHSRPSAYIPVGLDATVAYPVVDLKLRNPYDFPVVVRAKTDRGALVIELLGSSRPASVELARDTVGIARYRRKVEEVSWLPEGEVRLRQRGIRGYSIRKTRTIRLASGERRVEVTTDVYPPTVEIYEVARGTDLEAVLPPLPGDEADGRRAANADGPAATGAAQAPN